MKLGDFDLIHYFSTDLRFYFLITVDIYEEMRVKVYAGLFFQLINERLVFFLFLSWIGRYEVCYEAWR